MKFGTFRRTHTFAGTILAFIVSLAPLSAHAIEVGGADPVPTATPTPAGPTPTPGPIAYTPKTVAGKCQFPSDKLIQKALTEQIKISLAARGIAKPSVRLKLQNGTPIGAGNLHLTDMGFSALPSTGGGPLDYTVQNYGEAVMLGCHADRVLDITVSANVNGAKVAATTHTHLSIQGLLK